MGAMGIFDLVSFGLLGTQVRLLPLPCFTFRGFLHGIKNGHRRKRLQLDDQAVEEV